MKQWAQMGQALYQVWLRLAVPRALYYINGPDTLPAPLDPEEEKQVFADLAAGQPGARDTLITHNLRLHCKKIRKPHHRRRGHDLHWHDRFDQGGQHL